MTKKVNSLLESLRTGAKTGLESGVWFSPIAENVGVEMFGKVERIFAYNYTAPGTRRAQERKAVEMRALAGCDFVLAKEGASETVSVAEGETILVTLTGQLEHLFNKYDVGPGTVVYLRYDGKDKSKLIQGNHPHSWTFNFRKFENGEAI